MPKPKRLRGEKRELQDMRELAAKEALVDMQGNKVQPKDVTTMFDQGRIIKQGTPNA